MKILSIGTSGKNCTVAISEDDRIIKELNINDGITHSQTLIPNVDKVFIETNMQLKDIDAYAVSIGPGSFTGIRIGIATIKGFCLGNDKKVFAVPSLLALAYNVCDYKGYIISCIDAKNDNVYSAIYDNTNFEMKKITDYVADNVSLLIEQIKKLDDTNNFMVVGDGKTLLKSSLEALNINDYKIEYAEDKFDLEYASSILKVAYQMERENNFTTGVSLTPLYLKKSQAERELDKKGE